MTEHGNEPVTLTQSEEHRLPDTLSANRDLTLVLVSTGNDGRTAVLELRNPQAEPDAMVAGLVEEHAEDVDHANRLRDVLHLPERAVPVDTSTAVTETLPVRLHEKLQIGDRVWTVSAISAASVTLTPGHDHESPSRLNEVLDEEYSPEAIALGDRLNAADEVL